ncbi:MAG TPA: acyl-CoA dehydrogenase family protein, partial [Rhizomicrobium sp.]|nr:acyl-CoA dehydrogenase family protein [Rhizomicrobium sp.]
MDFSWSGDDITYRNAVRAFLSNALPSGWSGYNKSDLKKYKADATKFCQALSERGWLTQNWPIEYGGQDASPWRHAILSEELWPLGEPRGAQYMNVNWIGPAIMAAGTPDQKAYHLRRISAGDVFWCQGFSEPDAGSDLPSLRTRAVRDGDDYIVNGSKIWTSHVGTADFCFLLVRTDPQASKRQGISILLVPMDTPGLEVRHIDGFVGEQAFHQLVFTDMRVPCAYRLGDENQGWNIVRKALAYERVGAAHYETARLLLDKIVAEARR